MLELSLWSTFLTMAQPSPPSPMLPISPISPRFNDLLKLVLTENAQSDTFKAPCCCFENAPNTFPTIVCTINVSIDCNWFDVPNLPQKKNILK